MKKYAVYSFVSLAAVSAFAASVVDDSSKNLNWSDASTWVDGALPTSSDTFTFEGNNTTLVVDSSDNALYGISIGENQTQNLIFNSGVSVNSGKNTYISGANKSTSILNISGESLFTNIKASNVRLNFDISNSTESDPRYVYITGANSNSTLDNVIVSFTGHYSGGRVNQMSNTEFYINENSSYKVVEDGYWNMHNMGTGKFVIAKNAKFITTQDKNGFYSNGTTISSGSMEIVGKFNLTQGQSYTMCFARNATFKAGATITQTATADSVSPDAAKGFDWRNVFINNCTFTVESGVAKNAFDLQSRVIFGGTVKLVLDSSDVFKSGVLESVNGKMTQQEQGKTTFYLQHRTFASSTGYTYSATNLTIDNNADNNIGKFAFYTGSTLTLLLDDTAKLAINGMELMEGATGEMKVYIDNLGKDTLFLGDDIFANSDIKFFDATSKNELVEGTDYELVAGEYNGVSGQWMNAIPEPSTYAAIFGTLALGLAVYRRRK